MSSVAVPTRGRPDLVAKLIVGSRSDDRPLLAEVGRSTPAAGAPGQFH